MAIYVVTGGAGFIGSHLTDALLARGHGVRVLDDLSTGHRANLDPRAEFIHADICDAAALRAALDGAAGCYHLAAIASVARANEDWAGTHRVNLTGTIMVLDACRAAHLPVVYASSAAVYGNIGDAVAHEGLTCAPQTAYGADKFGSELHAAVGWGVHGVPSFGLRFFNVYGPRQDPKSPYSGVISIFADRIARNQGVIVHGDGGQTRDFVYVARRGGASAGRHGAPQRQTRRLGQQCLHGARNLGARPGADAGRHLQGFRRYRARSGARRRHTALRGIGGTRARHAGCRGRCAAGGGVGVVVEGLGKRFFFEKKEAKNFCALSGTHRIKPR